MSKATDQERWVKQLYENQPFQFFWVWVNRFHVLASQWYETFEVHFEITTQSKPEAQNESQLESMTLLWSSQHTWYYSTHNLIEQSFSREGRDILSSTISFQTTFQTMFSFNCTNRIFIGILNKFRFWFPPGYIQILATKTSLENQGENKNLTLETWVFNYIVWINNTLFNTFFIIMCFPPWYFIYFVSQNLQFTPWMYIFRRERERGVCCFSLMKVK